MTTFTGTEERIINRIQADIPLVPAPFEAIAAELSMPLDRFLSTLAGLKERRIVRNISAIFNADRLGYRTSLVAFAVPEEKVEDAARIINAHPGVSHNYLRDHRYNLWFTLAVDGSTTLEDTAAVLAGRCGAADHLIMRNERLFKIGFLLKVGADEEDDEMERVPAAAPVEAGGSEVVTDELKEAVLMLQADLPIVRYPFREIIENAGGGMTDAELTAVGADLKRRGIMRRYAAVLKHYNAGYRANAMTAWKPGPLEERTLNVFMSSRHISHLYLRTLQPGKWEHPLFAMIHARGDRELEEIIKGIEEQSGIRDYLVLKSLREYKKQRVTYFSPAFENWYREYAR